MQSVERARKVEVDLARQGISGARVLDALRSVAREDFVPPEFAEFAYPSAAEAPVPRADPQIRSWTR
jgi:protein-L-isoaspartate O-methyltransferase